MVQANIMKMSDGLFLRVRPLLPGAACLPACLAACLPACLQPRQRNDGTCTAHGDVFPAPASCKASGITFPLVLVADLALWWTWNFAKLRNFIRQ